MSAEKFGRYVIRGEVGRGGMATVFHAYDPRFERDVAIKVLPREFLHDPQFRVRFEREAKTIALIEHPAIVPVYDFGDEDGQPYIVMRYMSGGSLSDRINKGPLTISEVADMISRLAPALDAAHSKGVIHRDMKPANILYDQYGNSFLSDFGIARLAQATSATLTGGAILGTPAYMSPEQVQGGVDIDGRSDIYSLGVILYQILAGKVPYQANTAAKLMMMHILEPVPHITDAKVELPAAFNTVIEKAMAKNPDDRYQTTVEMAQAVELAAHGADMPTIITPAGEDEAIPTHHRPAATVLSPSARSQERHTAAATHAAGSLVKPGAAPVKEAIPAARPRRKVPAWVWIISGLVLLGVIAAAFTLGGGMLLLNQQPSATFTATHAVVVAASNTPEPPATPTPTLEPSFTPSPTSAPMLTETPTMLPASDTPTPEPMAPVLGGADKLAFISDNDIYLVNVDGSELTRLTSDGGVKTNLQWTPDGQALAFVTGLCVKTIEIETSRIDNLLCFEYASSLDSFEISPDYQQLAIVVNQYLFVVPFDRERLSQVDFWDDIQAMAACEHLAPYSSSTNTPYAVKEVHWAADGLSLSLIVLTSISGVQVDVVRVIDISACVNNPSRIDEFPAERFTMGGYPANPRLPHVGYDGGVLFALTNIVRNEGFGDLYLYNMDVHRAQLRVNPIGGRCCYRDPEFSPDGSYLVFAFQDIGLGAQSVIELYYIPYGTLGTGLSYTPLPLPAEMFSNQRESPQPVLRPVVELP